MDHADHAKSTPFTSTGQQGRRLLLTIKKPQRLPTVNNQTTTTTMKSHCSGFPLVALAITAISLEWSVQGFAPASELALLPRMMRTTRTTTVLPAGGFEWEDPGEAFDQGVENPFKKTEVMEQGLKIDPARLLSPRMSGSNLYLIGMMGSGKSAVGKIVAKRK